MKLMIRILAAAGIFVSITGNAYAVDDNKMCLTTDDKSHPTPSPTIIKEFLYDPNSQWYSATDSSSWGGVSIDKSGCLHVYVNRDNSSVPKSFVEDGLAESSIHGMSPTRTNLPFSIAWNSSNMVGYGGGTPDELNFAIKGTLKIANGSINTPGTILFECRDVYIGQGHFAFGNNWWIFTNNNLSDQSITCKSINSSEYYQMKLKSDGTDKFNINWVYN